MPRPRHLGDERGYHPTEQERQQLTEFYGHEHDWDYEWLCVTASDGERFCQKQGLRRRSSMPKFQKKGK